MTIYTMGIDPGFGGAIAWLDTAVQRRDVVHDMPVVPGSKGKKELNYPALFEVMKTDGMVAEVWLEKVGVNPRDGRVGAFTFGRQVGALEMSAAANDHVLRYVTPSVWKAHFGLSADKDVARGYAMKRFPHLANQLARKKDDGRAEALLIALYGYEKSK